MLLITGDAPLSLQYRCVNQWQALKHRAVALWAEQEDALTKFRPPQVGRRLQGARLALQRGRGAMWSSCCRGGGSSGWDGRGAEK